MTTFIRATELDAYRHGTTVTPGELMLAAKRADDKGDTQQRTLYMRRARVELDRRLRYALRERP